MDQSIAIEYSTVHVTPLQKMMQRGIDHSGGGLGPQLVGEKIHVNRRVVSVNRQLGEGKLNVRKIYIIHYTLYMQYCHLSLLFLLIIVIVCLMFFFFTL